MGPDVENYDMNEAACAASALDDGLANSLPWHIGFHNEIADRLRQTGDWHPDIVRYKVVQVCDNDGRHVCWAKSPEHAALIIDAVNKMANAEVRGASRNGEASSAEGATSTVVLGGNEGDGNV